MNNWVLEKLMAYLIGKEGFTVSEQPEETNSGKKATVQDVFGYRYEIQVKALGRIKNDDDSDIFSSLSTKIAGFVQNTPVFKKGGN